MKRTIFFDLGNMLIFFDHDKMCQQIVECSGLDLSHVRNVMLDWDSYERGAINSQILHQKLCQMAQKKLHFETLMHAISDIFEPNDAVITLAELLKEKGHDLFLLSNTCDAHFDFVQSQFPFLKIFDGFVLSYEVGYRKPEKKIYEKALEIAGCQNGKQCFYTDDVLAFIETARTLNIDAEQYTNPEELKEHLCARGML